MKYTEIVATLLAAGCIFVVQRKITRRRRKEAKNTVEREGQSTLPYASLSSPSLRNLAGCVYSVHKWLQTNAILPTVTSAIAVAFSLNPSWFQNSGFFPALRSTYTSSFSQRSSTRTPTSMEIFRLGEIFAAVSNSSPSTEALLTEASALLGRSSLSLPELAAFKAGLTPTPGWSSLLTLGNALWLVSIVGLSVVTGPFLYHTAKPIMQRVIKFSIWIYYMLLVPLGHLTRPLLEALPYYLSLLLLVEGSRYPPSGQSGILTDGPGGYVALTGAAVGVPLCLGVTHRLWGGEWKDAVVLLAGALGLGAALGGGSTVGGYVACACGTWWGFRVASRCMRELVRSPDLGASLSFSAGGLVVLLAWLLTGRSPVLEGGALLVGVTLPLWVAQLYSLLVHWGRASAGGAHLGLLGVLALMGAGSQGLGGVTQAVGGHLGLLLAGVVLRGTHKWAGQSAGMYFGWWMGTFAGLYGLSAFLTTHSDLLVRMVSPL